MLNIRYRNNTNAWPGFVDLFSNLVIILIFLLIVFVFLWTTTSVFNKATGAKTIADLKQTNEEQAQKIQQMTASEMEAKRLLILANAELSNLENSNAELTNELAAVDVSIDELISAYEEKVSQLQAQGVDLQKSIAELTAQLTETRAAQAELAAQNTAMSEQTAQFQQQQQELSAQIAKLNDALAAAEEKSRAQEVEYVEMSNRLNRALADKVAELNNVSQYQSEFYKAIKNALGDRTTIRQDGDRFIISSDILFSSGSYKLSAEGKNQLRLIANIIKDFEEKIPTDIDWIVRVDGHTDSKPVIAGTRAYRNNMQLSLLRATAVASELEKAGVSKRRLLPTGFGETYPIALGNDASSLQKNRRIELQLTNR